MEMKQLSVPITEERRKKLNVFCAVNGIKQEDAVGTWVDTLPEYVSKV